MTKRKTPSATYLITWNPSSWAWDDYDDAIANVRAGEPEEMNWTCTTTKVRPGDRIFLLRQGNEGRGIVGAGYATEEPELDDEGRRRVNVELTELVPVAHRLDRSVLARGALAKAEPEWKTRFSGRRISDAIALELESVWEHHLNTVRAAATEKPSPAKEVTKKSTTSQAPVESDLLDDDASAFEGEERRRFVVHRSRERGLRERKLREAQQKGGGRLRCEVPRCGFDFEAVYGQVGEAFAHVHHLLPLAESKGPRETSLNELAVVCANCHAMIHRGGASRPIESLIPQRSSVVSRKTL